MIDRIEPTRRPPGPPAGFQRWRHLLFLHWEAPVPALQALLPEGLTVDTFEGKGYVGVVAFTMRDVSLAPLPAIPGTRHFHELNVRTYVHHHGRDPGVWFMSLDAASSAAVIAARATFHLPYFRASMRLEVEGDRILYRSRRLWPGPRPADLDTRYRIGAPIGASGTAEPGSFEHFLAERYLLFADAGRRGLKRGQVHHPPYPLRRAEVSELGETMVRASGLPEPEGAPHALYSPGVDVDVFGLEDVRT